MSLGFTADIQLPVYRNPFQQRDLSTVQEWLELSKKKNGIHLFQ
jgi:hypothetical protein